MPATTQESDSHAPTPRPLGALGVFAAVLGNGFEFFDFGVYAVYVGVIGRVFYPGDNPFLSDLASAATFGIGFVGRPLGGILIGAYADRVGRKPAMTLTIGLMALGSALTALLPGYAAIGVAAPVLLVVARLIQGFAAGGEMGPATMFMIKSAPPGRRNLYGSWQAASQALAHLAVGLTGFALASLLSEQSLSGWGWRLPFMLGIFIAPLGVFIRNRLHETLAREAGMAPPRVRAAMSSVLVGNWDGVLLGIGLICGGTIANYFLINMTPYAIRTLHLPASTAMLGAIALGVAGTIGALTGGSLADRFGMAPVIVVSRILMTLLLVPVMRFLVADPSTVNFVLAMTVLSFLHASSLAVVIVLMQQVFPAAIRSTGLSFTYAVGVAVFGGTTTYVVTWLVGITGDPLASVYYVLAANLLSLTPLLVIRRYSDSAAPDLPERAAPQRAS